MESAIGIIIIGMIVLFVIFLIMRELLCWYYKINEGIELLDRQVKLLESINAHLKKSDRASLTDEEKALLFDGHKER